MTPSGAATRPTSGRLKKSLFDILAPRLGGAQVLDLFAGAGALGIEALSRGAARAIFVERGRAAASAIRANLTRLELSGRAEVLPRDAVGALGALARSGARFDVVFLDPPYGSGIHQEALARLGELPLLAPEAVVVLEHHVKTEIAETYGALVRSRRVRAGESCLTFFEPAGRSDAGGQI